MMKKIMMGALILSATSFAATGSSTTGTTNLTVQVEVSDAIKVPSSGSLDFGIIPAIASASYKIEILDKEAAVLPVVASDTTKDVLVEMESSIELKMAGGTATDVLNAKLITNYGIPDLTTNSLTIPNIGSADGNHDLVIGGEIKVGSVAPAKGIYIGATTITFSYK